MQNSHFKFHMNLFQSLNFCFIQLSPLNFKYVQLRFLSNFVKCLPLKFKILKFHKPKLQKLFFIFILLLLFKERKCGFLFGI